MGGSQPRPPSLTDSAQNMRKVRPQLHTETYFLESSLTTCDMKSFNVITTNSSTQPRERKSGETARDTGDHVHLSLGDWEQQASDIPNIPSLPLPLRTSPQGEGGRG